MSLGTMMVQGNMETAYFWHQPPNVVSGNKTPNFKPHKDTLIYGIDSLERDCPTGDSGTIASTVAQS